MTNYDNATVTVEGLQGDATLTAGEVTTSSPNAGTYTYTGTTAPTAADGMTITTPFQTSDDISNYNVTYNFTQTITKKEAEIDIVATKIYDGTPLVVNYNDATVTVTGLVAGDALNAGKATSAVGTTPSYKVGQYTYTYTPSGMALSFAPVNGTVLLDPAFNTINGIENYSVTYNLELDITLRTLEITAADAEKVYDGTPLTSDVYTIAAVDGLAEGDQITTIAQGGSQLCVGSTEHTISGAVIVKGEENVTDQYTITYHNGTLTVTNFTDFTCPAAENITLNYGECETEYTIQGEPTVGTGMAAGSYTITNDLADQNPLPVGTHTITWMLIDDCGNTMATCTQTVTVEYPECPDATDADGNIYEGVRIGCECWTQTNLRSEHYQITGSPEIPDVMTYKASPYYDNETANLNNYGHLYTWNAAINGGDTNSYGHVQGICPAGWYLPTKAQYDGLAAYGPDALRANSTLWADGGGSNTTGFTGLPGGRYVGSIDRYRDMTLMDYYWATTTTEAGEVSAVEVELTVNCLRVKDVQNTNPNGYSIRCVKERE